MNWWATGLPKDRWPKTHRTVAMAESVYASIIVLLMKTKIKRYPFEQCQPASLDAIKNYITSMIYWAAKGDKDVFQGGYLQIIYGKEVFKVEPQRSIIWEKGLESLAETWQSVKKEIESETLREQFLKMRGYR